MSDVLISTPSGIVLYDSEQICVDGIITLTSRFLRTTPTVVLYIQLVIQILLGPSLF